MEKIHVKICCISSIAEAQIAIAAGASAIGDIASMPSDSRVDLFSNVRTNGKLDFDKLSLFFKNVKITRN